MPFSCIDSCFSRLSPCLRIHALRIHALAPLCHPSVPQFKLRDLVDYVADVLAHNAVSAAAAARLGPASDAIATRLKGVRRWLAVQLHIRHTC